MLTTLLPRSSAPIMRSLSSVTSAPPPPRASPCRPAPSACRARRRSARFRTPRRRPTSRAGTRIAGDGDPEEAVEGRYGPSGRLLRCAGDVARAMPHAMAVSPCAPAGDASSTSVVQALVQHMGVDLGRGHVGMAEQRLDHAQVGAARQQVRGEGVAQGVRRDPRRVEAGEPAPGPSPARGTPAGSGALPCRGAGKQVARGGLARRPGPRPRPRRARPARPSAPRAAGPDSGTIRSLPPLPRTRIIARIAPRGRRRAAPPVPTRACPVA